MKTLVLLCSLGLLAPLCAQPALLASGARSFDTGPGTQPFAVAVADLDGDGVPDAALANVGGQARASLLFGRGDGTFAAPVLVPLPQRGSDVVAADLDGDGDTDLAFAGSDGVSGSSVLVLLGDGSGGFAAPRAVFAGARPRALAVLDADRDGDPDLAVANHGASELVLLRNDGSGGFARTVAAALPARPSSVAAGDLDGDGSADLALAFDGGDPAVAVALNDGSGGFPALARYGKSRFVVAFPGVALGDLDRDGDLDVLSGADFEGVLVFDNPGTGALAAPRSLRLPESGQLSAIEVADVDGDGNPDVAATAYAGDGWTLLSGDGAGGIARRAFHPGGERAQDLAVADVDADGDLDALVVNEGSRTLKVHESRGGTFSLPGGASVGGFATKPTVADVDGDGDLDAVAVTSTLYTARNDGSGGFHVGTRAMMRSVLDHPRLADLDGDGAPDLLMLKDLEQGLGSYDLYTARNRGDGTFGVILAWGIARRADDLEVADLDGDGDLDVVVPTLSADQILLLFNDGNGVLQRPVSVVDPTVGPTRELAIADVDGDGDPDLLGGSTNLRFYENLGGGRFAAPWLSGSGSTGIVEIATGDLDLDGRVDVVTADWGSGISSPSVAVWLGRGDGSFRPPATYPGAWSLQWAGLSGLAVADLDGDGYDDVAAGAYGGQDVVLWRNLGDGTLAPGAGYGVRGRPIGLATGDFDGDGATDVLAGLSPVETGVTGLLALLRGLQPSRFPALPGGIAGSRGVPDLRAGGTLAGGTPVRFALSRARPGASGVLAFGSRLLGAPLLGGTLVPDPVAPVPFVADAEGLATFSFPWPAGVAAGAAVWTQAWALDPAGPRGAAASDGRGAIQR